MHVGAGLAAREPVDQYDEWGLLRGLGDAESAGERVAGSVFERQNDASVAGGEFDIAAFSNRVSQRLEVRSPPGRPWTECGKGQAHGSPKSQAGPLLGPAGLSLICDALVDSIAAGSADRTVPWLRSGVEGEAFCVLHRFAHNWLGKAAPLLVQSGAVSTFT